MNTEQAVEHGKRWLAAGWTWKRGQVAVYLDDDGERWTFLVNDVGPDGRPVGMPANAVPDPRDDGTRGHMLSQVREAWGDPNLVAVRSCRGAGTHESVPLEGSERTPSGGWRLMQWIVVADDSSQRVYGLWCGTEAAALLAAREAAPGMKPAPPG